MPDSGTKREMRGLLLHFGANLWYETWKRPGKPRSAQVATDYLQLDEGLWRETTDRMAAKGLNTVVIDLAEAVIYPSHPELAVKGSWTVDRFRAELERLRKIGLTPYPKLNFSAAHDTWLKDYGRMLSTPTYYKVCRDLIRDVAEIFDRPEFLHIGMDEELPMYQLPDVYEMCIVRRGELWWHDFLYLVKECEAAGMRAWAWSDYAWWHPRTFVTRCPKSVLLSDWCYCTNFDLAHEVADGRWAIRNFIDFDNAGFEQVPTGSNYNPTVTKGFGPLVDFCDAHIAPERLRGYLQTPWAVMIPKYRDRVLASVDIAAAKFSERGELPSAAQRRYSAEENRKLVLPDDADEQIAARKAKNPNYFAPWSSKAWNGK